MTLLVISPDYASHLLPLASLATAWRDRGEEVVVATGAATEAIVDEFGYRRVELALGRGSNAGVLRPGEQPRDEAASLQGFFEATRRGMVETLGYQARERLTDLMWQPVEKARDVQRIVAEVSPSAILVDHLAYSARLGLDAVGVGYADVVLGHPSALPVADEVYGYPPAWPSAFSPDDGDLSVLRRTCDEVSRRFTRQWNDAAAALGGGIVDDAFAAHGELTLFNYPPELARDGRSLPPAGFLRATLRDERVDPEIDEWIKCGAYVYVSFGSFLSVRGDVLRVVAEALRELGVRAAIATGSTDPSELGEIPEDWLVRAVLPQVRLLRDAAASVTHGGNNSVTEALAHGVPLVVLPFSTDQFAGAAAIERSRVGSALAPNTVSVEELRQALARVLAGDGIDGDLLRHLRDERSTLSGADAAYAAVASARI